MQLDKKVSAGEVKFVLARAIGRVEYGQKVPTTLLEKVLTTLAGRKPGEGTEGTKVTKRKFGKNKKIGTKISKSAICNPQSAIST
jgi:hypothetical protein